MSNSMKEAVRAYYAHAAQKRAFGVPTSCGCRSDYSAQALASLPAEARLGLGCGNPLSLAKLPRGATVLDLGSGAGMDCLLAAQEVGPEGQVIGVDFTPEMITLARENAQKMGAANVTFIQGDIEALPLPDCSVDAVISNCVINLVPDKALAFRQAFRVLKPGGLLLVADLVRAGDFQATREANPEAYARCLAGTIPEVDYLAAIQSAGFQVEYVERNISTGPIGALQVRARRPL